MGFDIKKEPGSMAARESSHSKAPGKKTLTGDMPPKKEPKHREMTGIEALDNDASQDGGEGFFLEPYQRLELRRIVQAGILIWLSSVMTALSNTKLAYFTFSPDYSICKNNHYIRGKHDFCPKCGAKIVDHINRVVGYFTRVSGWNPGKQREYNERKRYLLK